MKTKCNTILVSGGAGFVGSHLCSRLLQDGYSVVPCDLKQKRWMFLIIKV